MSMTWKPIDFQGIVSLEKSVVDHLKQYLNEKESQLGNTITHAIHTFPTETLPVVIPFSSGDALRLSDAVMAFGKNVSEISKSERSLVPADDWESAIREINEALWEYNEVLEGCVTELFQQINQIGVEGWSPGLLGVVRSIKTMLLDQMDQLGVVEEQLEGLLWKYRWACESRKGRGVWFKKIWYKWRRLLDRNLGSFLKETKKSLNLRYQKFVDRYHRYQSLNQKIDKSVAKFDGYQVFNELDEDVQKELKHLYRLIKLWKYNSESRLLPQENTIQALRKSFRAEKSYQLFHEYYEELQESLFDRSRLLKRNLNEFFQEVINRPLAHDMISGCRKELHTLAAMISSYRNFFLKTHPNPYVRSRWGFPEWIVGPEPESSMALLHLVFDVEKLEDLFNELEGALKEGKEPQNNYTLERKYREIEKILHEMGQPLTTRSVMRSRAEELLERLEDMNELGSFNENVVGYVGKIFSKALRADWQYHVLFEFPLFHELYAIHQGILGSYENRHHLNRMNKFKDLIVQIEDWVKRRDVHRHMHEIEMDMNDMKESLQEFLVYVQRMTDRVEAEKETLENVIQDIQLQLLEYRYLFGNFFHYLHQYEPDGKLIRNQFLFVDQYFETVENRLQDLRSEMNMK